MGPSAGPDAGSYEYTLALGPTAGRPPPVNTRLARPTGRGDRPPESRTTSGTPAAAGAGRRPGSAEIAPGWRGAVARAAPAGDPGRAARAGAAPPPPPPPRPPR